MAALIKHTLLTPEGDSRVLWLLPPEERPTIPPGWRVLRVANATACYACGEQQGLYDADDPFCWDTHPNCFIGGHLVSGAAALGSTTRHYAGDCVHLLTAGGYRLAGTPNHPILTPRGWVALGMLQKGDDVVCGTGLKCFSGTGISPDDYQTPALIEEVAESLGRSSKGSTSMVPTTAIDFHGDGTDGDVCIVRTNGLLCSAGDAPIEQPPLQQQFSRRGVGTGSLTGLGAGAQNLPSIALAASSSVGGLDETALLLLSALPKGDRVCGGSASNGNSRSEQAFPNDGTARVEIRGDRLFALAGSVPATDGAVVQQMPRGNVALADRDSCVAQSITNCPVTDTTRDADLTQTFAGDVTTDQVISIDRQPFDGHVYNLQTPTQWYIANYIQDSTVYVPQGGVIVHNCQCKWHPIPKGVAMSKLNTAQRKALPLSDFGDPDNRLFPIVDQDDVDSAAHLIGKAKNPAAVKARISAIAKRKGLKLPEAWQSDAKMSAAAAFDDAGRRVEGDYAVYPNALLFEAGNYPDKAFSLSPEEMWAAVEQFTPVGGNIEHTPFLAGKACEVRSIRLDAEDNTRLRGEVAVPLALDGLLAGHERRLSCEWDREHKTLSGIALTVNPRIPEAALMAAFADRHDTYEGQSVLQSMHDMASRAGAICDAANAGAKAYYVSGHESKGMQAMHDAAVEHGAKCSAIGKTGAYSTAFGVLFAGSRHSASDAKDIQQIHDLSANQGASCARAANMGAKPAKKGKAMNLAFWKKTTPVERAELRAAGAEVPDEVVFSTAEELANARMAEERARFTELLQKERAARLESEAAAFADGLITANKAFPAERTAIIAAYTQAAMDDVTHGAVTFADGKTAARVEQLKALYAARPAHNLTTEGIDPNGKVRILPAAFAGAQDDKTLVPTPDGQSVAPERVAHLLKLAGLPASKEA